MESRGTRVDLAQRRRLLLQVVLVVAHLLHGLRVDAVFVLNANATCLPQQVATHALHLAQQLISRNVERVSKIKMKVKYSVGLITIEGKVDELFT